MMCKLKKKINRFNQRLQIPLPSQYHHRSLLLNAVSDAVDALLIQNAENIFNYEIDKVIMNAKHLIDFSNLLKVTVPAGSDCTTSSHKQW